MNFCIKNKNNSKCFTFEDPQNLRKKHYFKLLALETWNRYN